MSEKLMQTDIDKKGLYEEKQYTDFKAGGIKAFFPVNPDGTPDESRDAFFMAVTNIDVGNGQFYPVQAKVEDATTLDQALIDFMPTLDDELQKLIDQANARQQKENTPLDTPVDDGKILTFPQK